MFLWLSRLIIILQFSSHINILKMLRCDLHAKSDAASKTLWTFGRRLSQTSTRNLMWLDLMNLHSHILETGKKKKKKKIHKGTTHLLLKNVTANQADWKHQVNSWHCVLMKKTQNKTDSNNCWWATRFEKDVYWNLKAQCVKVSAT